MKYTTLTPPVLHKSTINVFGGYNCNDSCPENCFLDTYNTTSDSFPLLTVRESRYKLAPIDDSYDEDSALSAVNGISYVAGTSLFYNNVCQYNGLTLSAKRQIVPMGSKLIVFPDGYYINTLSVDRDGICTDKGYLLPTVDLSDSVIVATPCTPDQPMPHNSTTAPASPADGDYWLNTEVIPHVLNVYDGKEAKWVNVEITHTSIYALGIGQAVRGGCPVEIQGISEGVDGRAAAVAVSDDLILLATPTDRTKVYIPGEGNTVTVRGLLPVMDFVCEHQNRLFGCRYGENVFGELVNEIYASKLGCPDVWFEYDGLSTDSYAASCGSEGAFTGAISHLGYVVFFKENRIHRLFGTKPANYTLYEDVFPGVKAGSENSLALCDGTLFYHGVNGIYAYTGSSPAIISHPLGSDPFTDAVGACMKHKYYVAMTAGDGVREVFTYDIDRDLWHIEDTKNVTAMVGCGNNVLAVIKDTNDNDHLYLMSAKDVPPVCTELYGSTAEKEYIPMWGAVTGRIGLSSSDNKYLVKLQLRAALGEQSAMNVYFSTNIDKGWEKCCTVDGPFDGTQTVNILPPRCDSLWLNIKGTGSFKLYSITKYLEPAGDIS